MIKGYCYNCMEYYWYKRKQPPKICPHCLHKFAGEKLYN